MKFPKKIENLKNNMKKSDFFKDDEEKEKKKIILYIIIIAILLLLLITSCTSGFFGKIGSLFRNEGNYTIDNDKNIKEEVLNQNLKFDSDVFEMSANDPNLKVSFTYDSINPSSFTCTTSDASIATCYVSDGYVIVNPKNKGEVLIYLQTDTNGKIYKASTKVNILEGNRKIELTSSKGTIYLGSYAFKNVTFSLVGLSGEVTATSSNDKVATAEVENGVLKIHGLKSGNATITLSLTYNDKTFTTTYQVNVVDSKNPSEVSSTSKPDKNEQDKPEDKDPEKPGDNVNDSISTLDRLLSNDGVFSKVGNTYYLGVGAWTFTTTIDVFPTNKNATVTYTYKRADKEEYEILSSLKDLKLKMGDNIVLITVTSPDKTSTTTYTVVINRAYSSKNYLKDIKVNGTTIAGFNKNTLSYELFVDSTTNVIDFEAIAWSKKANLTYTFNGVDTKNVDQLNLLTGPNSLKIHVIDQDGNKRTYNLLINRIRPSESVDTNSYLKDLSITNNLNESVPISFDPYLFAYSIGVDYDVERLSFLATPSSNSSSVVVSYIYKGKTYSTNHLKDIVLDYGSNEVEIKVENNGSVKTYKVIVNRATRNKSTSLTNLTISDGFVLNPTFSENTLEYKVTVLEGTNSITLKGTARSDTTIITYNESLDGTISLNDGNNKVLVKASDGVNERIYTVNIYRESSTLSNDASIKKIEVLVPGEAASRDITTTFKTTVGKDISEVDLNVLPTNIQASVTYNGNVSGHISLMPGINIIPIEIVAEDGTKKMYEVMIEREKEIIIPENPTIDKIIINGEEKDVTSGSTTVYIALDEQVAIEEISTEHVNVKYIYNGKEFTSVLDLNREVNATIKNGSNTVNVVISNKDDTLSNTYSIYLIKDKSYLSISADRYSLDVLDATGLNYSVTIPYNENNLKLNVLPLDNDNTTISYILNDEEINLEELNNKLNKTNNSLKIKVSSKDGLVNREYNLQINKPIRTIEVVSKPSDCYIENDTVCSIKFKVVETIDGQNYTTVKEEIKNIVIDIDNTNVSLVPIEFTEEGIGEIKLNPTSAMMPGDVSLTLGIKNYNNTIVTSTIAFKVHNNYELSTKLNSYTLGLSVDDAGKNSGTKTIILYSQKEPIFTGNVTSFYENNILTIQSVRTPDTKIVISTNDDASTITDIQYNPSAPEIGPTSLPISITAQKPGKVTLNIAGYVKGSLVKEFTIDLTIVQKYVVNLHANGGLFDLANNDSEISTKQSYLLELGDILGLSKLTPFKGADANNCKYYEFLGYSEDKNATAPSITGDFIIRESLNPITDLYAIYDESLALPTPDDKIFKTMWIFNPKLFINKEANNKTLIYPGANGKYTLNFTNTTGNKIKLVGLSLVENTVCVSEGCLNMGYIIKAATTGIYYLGNNTNATCGSDSLQYCNPNYSILNNGSNTTRNENNITFKTNETITLQDGESVSFYLDWKWVDNNNALDTAIGKKANTTNEEEINDQYHLNFGIHYTIVNDTCPISTD